MEILEIDKYLLTALHENAEKSERLRMNHDLRTTEKDSSQRMLNALEPGTRVPIHRHLETSETTICLEGCLDVIFYENRMKDGIAESANVANSTIIADDAEIEMIEHCRVRLCPVEGKYGIQIPPGTWHSIEVYVPSTIFEAKDGKYNDARMKKE